MYFLSSFYRKCNVTCKNLYYCICSERGNPPENPDCVAALPSNVPNQLSGAFPERKETAAVRAVGLRQASQIQQLTKDKKTAELFCSRVPLSSCSFYEIKFTHSIDRRCSLICPRNVFNLSGSFNNLSTSSVLTMISV